jgi:DNA-binding NtrC family response regulator
MNDAPNTVLVVDDCPAILQVLQAILTHAGFDVVVAENGREAVARFEADPDAIVLALVDVRMPVMDGPATVAYLHSVRPGLPCLFTSGEPGPYTREALRRFGCAGFIAKPFDVDEVVQLVRTTARSTRLT